MLAMSLAADSLTRRSSRPFLRLARRLLLRQTLESLQGQRMGEPALLESMSAVGPGMLEQYALQQLLAHVGVLIGRRHPHGVCSLHRPGGVLDIVAVGFMGEPGAHDMTCCVLSSHVYAKSARACGIRSAPDFWRVRRDFC